MDEDHTKPTHVYQEIAMEVVKWTKNIQILTGTEPKSCLVLHQLTQNPQAHLPKKLKKIFEMD